MHDDWYECGTRDRSRGSWRRGKKGTKVKHSGNERRRERETLTPSRGANDASPHRNPDPPAVLLLLLDLLPSPASLSEFSSSTKTGNPLLVAPGFELRVLLVPGFSSPTRSTRATPVGGSSARRPRRRSGEEGREAVEVDARGEEEEEGVTVWARRRRRMGW